MPPMTNMLCGRGSSKPSSCGWERNSSCSCRSVTLGLWCLIRRARRRSDAENVDARVSAEDAEKKEPGENSSLSRLESGDVVPVDELLEAYAPRVPKAVFNRRRKEDACGTGESDWNIALFMIC